MKNVKSSQMIQREKQPAQISYLIAEPVHNLIGRVGSETGHLCGKLGLIMVYTQTAVFLNFHCVPTMVVISHFELKDGQQNREELGAVYLCANVPLISGYDFSWSGHFSRASLMS